MNSRLGRGAVEFVRARGIDLSVGRASHETRDGDGKSGTHARVATTIAAMIGMAVILWLVSITNSILVTAAVAVVLLPALCLVQWLRFPFVIIGGLTILYSSNSLDKAKVLYMAGMLCVSVVALLRLRGRRSTPTYRQMRPLLIWSAVWLLVICASGILGIAHRHAWVDVVRDAAPYVLVCFVPLIVYDTYEVAQDYVTGLFVAAAIASALSFTMFVLVRRSVVLPVEYVVLPSALLPASLFCFAMARALYRRDQRLLWGFLAGVTLIALLASGSRTYVLLLIAPVVLVLLETTAWRRVMKFAGVLLGIGLLMVGAFYAVRGIAGLHGHTVLDRFWGLPSFISNPTADDSLQERITETKIAFNAFAAQPVLGAGLGQIFKWRPPWGGSIEAFTLDTTVAYAAKFGLLGIVALSAAGVAWFKLAAALGREGFRVAAAALIAYLVLAALLFPLGAPLEDKGFSFGLMFLLSLALGSSSQRVRGGEDVTEAGFAA